MMIQIIAVTFAPIEYRYMVYRISVRWSMCFYFREETITFYISADLNLQYDMLDSACLI
jgi:hypothetical protein